MSENKKIEKVDIESIKELRQKSSELIVKFGEVELEFIYAENRKNELDTYKAGLVKELTELQESEKTLTTDMETKYGQGNLNLETGEFTPA
tara:strand:+ start:3930 stop:4202 length:273 start_codon:yes stop_codon:yes gene_type:complete